MLEIVEGSLREVPDCAYLLSGLLDHRFSIHLDFSGFHAFWLYCKKLPCRWSRVNWIGPSCRVTLEPFCKLKTFWADCYNLLVLQLATARPITVALSHAGIRTCVVNSRKAPIVSFPRTMPKYQFKVGLRIHCQEDRVKQEDLGSIPAKTKRFSSLLGYKEVGIKWIQSCQIEYWCI